MSIGYSFDPHDIAFGQIHTTLDIDDLILNKADKLYFCNSDSSLFKDKSTGCIRYATV